MRIAVLCDVVGRYGGTERYWETVLPELARIHDVRLLARTVQEPQRFGVPADQVRWSDENTAPCAQAAEQVAKAISDCQTVITSNVFDAGVLRAVRKHSGRWIARVHDYRPVCPNGNKVFPQFPSVCTAPMGAACVGAAFVRGCVRGPRVESMRRIAQRMRVRDEIAQAHLVLVSSEYMRETCAQNHIPVDRLRITPPPLPEAAFATIPVVPERGTALFSGRFNDQKGLHSLIRALGTIAPEHRPRLVVAGAGDQQEEQRGKLLADRCDVHVEWLGWLRPEALRAHIDRTQLTVVPSLWPEPFGLTGTEAQARGRPVVAYEVGGVMDWLAGGGIAVPRGDERALGRAIERLIIDPHTWETCAYGARRGAERYRLAAHLQVLRALVAIDDAAGGAA